MKIKVDKKNILSQMFDVRPVKKTGVLDTERILNLEKRLDLRRIEEENKNKRKRYLLDLGNCALFWQESQDKNKAEIEKVSLEDVCMTEEDVSKSEALKFKNFYENISQPENLISASINEPVKDIQANRKKELSGTITFDEKNQEAESAGFFEKAGGEIFQALAPIANSWKKSLAFFAAGCFLISSSIGALAICQKESEKISNIKQLGEQGFYSLLEAKEMIEERDFLGAAGEFQKALEKFEEGEEKISSAESLFAKIPDLFGKQTLSYSGISLMEFGRRISKAGSGILRAASILSESDLNPLDSKSINSVFSAKELFDGAAEEMEAAASLLSKLDAKNLPEEISKEAVKLKEKMPEAMAIIKKAQTYGKNILEILGGSNPRKYLLIFQNNAEMRANGGFIGSFGVLDVYKSRILNMRVDGIYNPAGQLLEKIIPPLPFKKVADRWNIFDANYFADFPASAKKISWFFEKTGGPTTDGIISFTPEVLEDLLKITGPIAVDEYGEILDSANVIEKIQYEVEEGYDKDENQPKKIVALLAEQILKKIFSSAKEDWKKYLQILGENLSQKRILFYFKNASEQKMAEDEKWAGSVLESEKDYLQIAHTNINGYKTDKMIEESAEHDIQINPDGNVIDTIAITKKHNGGGSLYDWYNRQNGDFLRVYVPLGSELVSAEGFSKEEIYSRTKDWTGFKADLDVEIMEKNMKRDEKSGVFIFEESEKTVFGGWMYTDPGQTSTVKLAYKLPFKVLPDESGYSILYQKQSGHPGLRLKTAIYNSGKLVEEKAGNLLEDKFYDFLKNVKN